MKIIGVAIKCIWEDNSYSVYACREGRHADIHEYLQTRNEHSIRYKYNYIEGFVIDAYNFVDRYEVFEIAHAASQILPTSDGYSLDTTGRTIALYSEDLW